MTTIITILVVLASIIMVLVVLVQKSKGGGLSSGFSSSNSIMGVRKTTDILEKATWGLAIFVMALSILCVRVNMYAIKTAAEKESVIGVQPVSAPVAPEFPMSAPVQQQPTTPPDENRGN